MHANATFLPPLPRGYKKDKTDKPCSTLPCHAKYNKKDKCGESHKTDKSDKRRKTDKSPKPDKRDKSH